MEGELVATKRNNQPEQMELFPTDPGIKGMIGIMFDEDVDMLVKHLVIKAWPFWPSLLNILARCGFGTTEKEVLINLGKLSCGLSGKVSWADLKNSKPDDFRQLALLAQGREPGEVNTKTLYGTQSHKALRILTNQGFLGGDNLWSLHSAWENCCELFQTPQVWVKNFLKAESLLSILKKELQNQAGELPLLLTNGQTDKMYQSGLTWLAWASFLLFAPKRMGELSHFFEVPCLPDNYLGRRRVDHAAVVNLNLAVCPNKPHMGHLLNYGEKTVISEWKMLLEKEIPAEPRSGHLSSMEDYLLRSIMALAMVKNGRSSFGGIGWNEFRGLIKYVRSFEAPISYQVSLPFFKGERALMELAACFNKVQERTRLRQLTHEILRMVEGLDPRKQLELNISSPSQLFLKMYGWKKN